MKKIIFLLMFFASTLLLTAQDSIKMLSKKEFKVVHNDTVPITIISELWLNGNYFGMTKFDSVVGTVVYKVSDWEFVKKQELNLEISNIKLHKYEEGENLPERYIYQKVATETMMQWRIYLRGD